MKKLSLILGLSVLSLSLSAASAFADAAVIHVECSRHKSVNVLGVYSSTKETCRTEVSVERLKQQNNTATFKELSNCDFSPYDITFELNEGRSITVEAIQVKNARKGKFSVVERTELPIAEGITFTQAFSKVTNGNGLGCSFRIGQIQ